MAGVHFAGYPPFLAQLTGSRYAFNMLVAGTIRIVGATLHVALKGVEQNPHPGTGRGHDPGGGGGRKKIRD
ncbi:MAG: 4-hydroxythreonine-4-phosphate dehydrogenase PdxA [Desulfosudis oleivorans]|nr:4-hydroxythreonine-4-phosphate dehydrogenase PdxA [Desulfosudis oleivorans]